MKFLVDRMLGKLAKELRMLGYDTIYYQGEDIHRLFHISREEGRVILTRSSKLLPKKTEDRIVRIREDNPLLQLKELIHMGIIKLDEGNLFSRCLLCNLEIIKIPSGEAEGRVPDFVFHQMQEFFRCPRCGRIYWEGSHRKNMERKIEELFQAQNNIKSQDSNES